MKNLGRLQEPTAEAFADILDEKGIAYDLAPDNQDPDFVIIQVATGNYDKAKALLNTFKESHKSDFLSLPNYQQFRTIVVPVDFSAYSRHISCIAVRLAEKYEARLVLVHAFATPVIDTMSPEGYTARIDVIMHDLKESAQQHMNDLKAYVESEIHTDKISLETMVINSSMDNLVDAIEAQIEADLYILGMRGKGESRSTTLGSVALRFIAEARVPVLVIPQQSDYKGVDYINDVVYTTDFDESDFPAIKKLMGFIAPFQPNIHCLHVTKEGKQQWEKVKMRGLKSYFEDTYKYNNVSIAFVQHDHIVSGVDQYIRENDIGLVCFTTHKRNLLTKLFNPSITKEMLLHTHVPILVFHA